MDAVQKGIVGQKFIRSGNDQPGDEEIPELVEKTGPPGQSAIDGVPSGRAGMHFPVGHGIIQNGQGRQLARGRQSAARRGENVGLGSRVDGPNRTRRREESKKEEQCEHGS